jgi:hypothetical protein
VVVDRTWNFDEVFVAEFTAVERTVFLIVQDREVAKDVTQDAFLALLRAWWKVSRYEPRSRSARPAPAPSRQLGRSAPAPAPASCPKVQRASAIDVVDAVRSAVVLVAGLKPTFARVLVAVDRWLKVS